jgi:hypothetical protein
MIKYHDTIIQGTDEWLNLRLGILTASEIKHILTPKLKIADNDNTRQHVYELLSQRITQYIEPHYISDDMLRGQRDEEIARDLYSEHFAEVKEVGFVTNNKFGFIIGYSPDGLVGDDGLIEIKCPLQKYHIETLLTNLVPEKHILQLQTGLLVSERKWIDFISYCGGMILKPIRVYPDDKIQCAIIEAACQFEEKINEMMSRYNDIISGKEKYIETEREIEMEITV